MHHSRQTCTPEEIQSWNQTFAHVNTNNKKTGRDTISSQKDFGLSNTNVFWFGLGKRK
jgi:hypothetical protein